MILWWCNINYDDEFVTFEEFAENKAKGKYPNGQLPCLYVEDNVQLCQTQAIARYLARRFKGRNSEVLYPGPSDPDLMGKMDNMMELILNTFENAYKFMAPVHPEYENREAHRAKFIEE